MYFKEICTLYYKQTKGKNVETGTLFHWIVSKDIFIMAQMLQKREIWNYLA